MTIVIGVGNTMRRDDGAGPAVIAELRGRTRAALAVTDGEPARLIELWAGADLAIVVDAVRAAPADSGSVHELDLETVQAASFATAAGTHALGLGDAVALGRALDRMPHRLHVFAIEGRDFDFGPTLSPPVQAAVKATASRVLTLLDQPH